MKWTYFMFFMAVLISIITIVMSDAMDLFAVEVGISTGYIGLLLSMLPMMLGFFPSYFTDLRSVAGSKIGWRT